MLAQATRVRTSDLPPNRMWPFLLTLLLTVSALVAAISLSVTHTIQQTSTTPSLSKLPLSFEPNAGQTNGEVQYMARASGGTFYFAPSEVVLSLKGASPDTGVLRTSLRALILCRS